MGKGEIAYYEQFLLFAQCFQMACFPGASKGVIVWEWVNYKIFDWSNLKDSADDKVIVTSKLNFVWGRVEIIVGKGENAGYQHFFSFSHNDFKRILSQGF